MRYTPRISAVLASAVGATIFAAAPARAPAGSPPLLFATSDRCVACHNGMTTPLGEDVSIGFAWRASIMANAARDPYWQAAVRREVLDRPADSAAIQDECSACHMPMARWQARVAGRKQEIFSQLGGGSREGGADPQAIDGVSCALCHQLENGGPGLEHDGQFRIDTTRPWGERLVLGPYDVPRERAQVMHSATGFVPARATNMERSELCSTCHTLYTEAEAGTTADGRKQTVRFPEQVPYLEWSASAYAREKTCQACHMTFTTEAAPAASVLGEGRVGFARHGFQGANFFMLAMLERYRAELGVAALPQELTLSRQRTLDLLRTGAARVTIARADVRDSRLEAEVVVTSTTGHKLPSAYPSRRAWLWFVVRDAGGRTVWTSGALRPDGSIVGNDNDRDPRAFEPHHRVIESEDDVQIYESILADARGQVTTGLLSAVRYAKDNRLLPRGFDKGAAAEDVAVRGDARDDPDFQGGGDRIVYRARLPAGATGPFRVDVELDYQPIGFRWAHNLEGYRAAAEPARFVRYYEATSAGSATTLAAASASVPDDHR
jgi:hypothetical protein